MCQIEEIERAKVVTEDDSQSSAKESQASADVIDLTKWAPLPEVDPVQVYTGKQLDKLGQKGKGKPKMTSPALHEFVNLFIIPDKNWFWLKVYNNLLEMSIS